MKDTKDAIAMDTFQLQHQQQYQTWLHSQQTKRTPTYPPSSPDPWLNFAQPSPEAFFWQSDPSNGSPPRTPGISLSSSSTNSGSVCSESPPPAAEDVLKDPILEYISDILMDENMEDRKCMQQECTAYQAKINSFYQVMAPRDPETGQDEDYKWIDEVLVAEPKNEEGEGEEATEQAVEWNAVHDNDLEKDSNSWPWPDHIDSSNSTRSFSSSELRSFDSFSSSDSPVSVYSQADSPTGLVNPGYGVSPAQAALVSANMQDSVALPALPTLPILQEILQSTSLVIQSGRRASEKKSLLYKPQNGLENLQVKPLSYLRGGMQESATLFEQSVRPSSADSKAASFPSLRNGSFSEFEEKKEPQSHSDASKADEAPISFVNNEYLRAETHAKLYGDWLPSKNNCLAKKMKAREANKGNGNKNGIPEPVDLRALLVDCAQAFGSGNLRKANELVQELKQYASPDGSVAQRLAHYFTEGLVARLEGTGSQLYTAMSTNRPSAAIMMKAYRVMVEVCPNVKISHYFANHNILKVAEGASRLHIVDYGILYGVQWPSLISALAERKGGPPFLRITGIELPQPGVDPKERVEQTGRRLSEYARTYNVPFEYHAIARKWEDIEAADLNLSKGEVLVVNSVLRLRHLMDETVINPSPRRKVLSRIHSFNPDIVVTAVVNAGFNAPFFVSRFREALYYFSSKMDMIDTTICENDSQLRLLMERECIGRDILNVVACEGPERVERPETYRQWHARFERAGFKSVPLDKAVVSKARHVVKTCHHKDFTIDDDSKWLLLGWKGRINEGLSAWRPTGTPL